jgi:hypothetical protein
VRVRDDGVGLEELARGGLDPAHPAVGRADRADAEAVVEPHAGGRGPVREQAGDGPDALARAVRAGGMDQGGHERHRARRFGRRLPGDVGPDGEGGLDLAGQPRPGEDRPERPQQERDVAPGAGAQQRPEPGPRGDQQGTGPPVDREHRVDEAPVAPPAARPSPVELRGGVVPAREEADRRVLAEADLVRGIDRVQRDRVVEPQAEGGERPLEPGAVQQDVRAGVEGVAVALQSGGETSGRRARLADPHAVAETGQVERGGEAPHPGPHDDHAAGRHGRPTRSRTRRR